MNFNISRQHLNTKCGLHKKDYQESYPDNPNVRGHFNKFGKFIKCACHEHITKEKYDEIIPKIIDELFNAGLYETLKYFSKDEDFEYLNKKYDKLKKDNIDINSINAQKAGGSNIIIKSRQYNLYNVKDNNGINIEMKWTKENLINAFKLLDKPKSTTYSNISELLKRIKFSPVTVYSPIMTKRILEELECKTVFDPCIGWGGRLVGTTCLEGGYYTGCEPCVKTFQGLKNIVNDLELNDQVNIINKPVEEVLENELKDMVYDCCLTSPPYYNLEIYSDEDTQSINKFPTYELWLEKFIEPIIKYISEHVTKYSCWSVKNFKTDKQYNLLDDIITIHEKYGWIPFIEYGIKKNVNDGSKYGDITYVFIKN